MSGGSNPLKRAFGGDGMAWRREQEDVLAHAKQLGYDRDGGSIISPTDNKQDWESWRNGFVNWKNKNVALEKEGKAFWQRGSGGGGGEVSAPRARVEVGPSPIQEAAERNVYFPMLVPEYSAPQAFDYSAYMPSDSPFGGMGGLLYQPGTQQYQEAFPMDMNILRYQPPEIPGSRVQFSNPILGFDVEAAIEEAANIANGGGGGSSGTSGDGGRTGEVTPASIMGAAAVPGTGTNVKGYSVGADGKLYGVDQNGLVIGPSGYPSVDLTSRLLGQPRPPEFAFTTSGVVPNAPSSTDRVNPAQMDRYGQLPSVADRYGRPGGGSDTSAGKGSFGGMSEGLAGPR